MSPPGPAAPRAMAVVDETVERGTERPRSKGTRTIVSTGSYVVRIVRDTSHPIPKDRLALRSVLVDRPIRLVVVSIATGRRRLRVVSVVRVSE